MKKYGYRHGNTNHTLFIKYREDKVTLLIIYVDDMVVIGDDTEEIKRLQGYLSSEFDMKDIGGLKYFLGIKVAHSREDIYLSQWKKHGHLEVKGYTDADWAGNITDGRSTSGYFTFIGGNLVTWRSKKQNVVAKSIAEAE
ncbi:uncharacterized mitochondrial protein AtMg00810-like [Pyrus x bretschneideri]|uniref:uncharacterized mitochondrial protein AtMg00810-like n=1 Tax=Pyrus x bretschneideri TaxID=225117 RepID=UPI00202F2A2E|nr:uncharacterized mitochondrial protein AtMg00810-like [Pyrus x bretschneideri]